MSFTEIRAEHGSREYARICSDSCQQCGPVRARLLAQARAGNRARAERYMAAAREGREAWARAHPYATPPTASSASERSARLKHWGAWLRTERARRGLSRKALAQRIGAHVQSVGEWERGVCWPSTSYAPHLAAALNLSLEELWQDAEAAL